MNNLEKVLVGVLIVFVLLLFAIVAFCIPHDEALMFVIQHEGGLTKEPAHVGGKSYAGITQNNWTEWRMQQGDAVHLPLEVEVLGGENPSASPLVEKTSNLAVIKRFYYDYYETYHVWDLHPSLQLAYCDGVTLTGHEAVRIIQRIVGVRADGKWGRGTARAVQAFNNRIDGDKDRQWTAFQMFDKLKRNFFNHLVVSNQDDKKYLKGWFARSDDVLARTRGLIYGTE